MFGQRVSFPVKRGAEVRRCSARAPAGLMGARAGTSARCWRPKGCGRSSPPCPRTGMWRLPRKMLRASWGSKRSLEYDKKSSHVHVSFEESTFRGVFFLSRQHSGSAVSLRHFNEQRSSQKSDMKAYEGSTFVRIHVFCGGRTRLDVQKCMKSCQMSWTLLGMFQAGAASRSKRVKSLRSRGKDSCKSLSLTSEP